MDIAELLAFAVKNRASDLHLSAGLPPMIRVHGDIRRINLPPMEHEDVHAMVYDIMSDAQRKTYEEMLECDFSFGIPNLARFRVNAYNQERGAAVAFRTIPSKVLSLEELATPGQGQLATGVRLTRRLLLIAEADALELGRNEVWLGADVAHRPIVNTARIVVGVVVEQHEQPLAESRLEGLEARRVPAAGDDAESLALGR